MDRKKEGRVLYPMCSVAALACRGRWLDCLFRRFFFSILISVCASLSVSRVVGVGSVAAAAAEPLPNMCLVGIAA